MKNKYTLIDRLIRNVERTLHVVRVKLGIQRRSRDGASARIGIYVAYFDASWIFEDHLKSFRDLSAGTFNYYVMANCTSKQERKWFDSTMLKYKFVKIFNPRPMLLPLTHGESLQRMIDQTDDDIIVLCDVDAFPIKKGWDDFIISELKTKYAVSTIVEMRNREMPFFLHPCFLAFKRSLLKDGKIDVLPDHLNDPAYKITQYLAKLGKLNQENVTPLPPTKRCIALAPPSENEFLGHKDLIHGFGTTYSDWVFHFWFARYIAAKDGVTDGDLRLGTDVINPLIEQELAKLRQICAEALKN